MRLLTRSARPTPATALSHAPAGPATRPMLAIALRTAADAIALEHGVDPADGTQGGFAMMFAVVWSRLMKFDAADPGWSDRDRFVLSTASATPLLLALLRLTGHDSMRPGEPPGDQRPWESLAFQCDHCPAVGLTAAAGGQAIAAAVGMALSERVLSTRFGKSLVDHRVWAMARADELAQGVTHEAISFAGQMRLDRLALLVEATDADSTDDARARFASCGWVVKAADPRDAADLEAALSFALRSRKPTLVWCIGGTPSTRAVQAAAPESWRALGSRGSADRRGWLKRIARHAQRPEFERVTTARLPESWHESLAALKHQLKLTRDVASPAQACLQLIDSLAAVIPELLCARSGSPVPAAVTDILPGRYAGRTVHFGCRPLGMLACLNGMAVHGGVLPIALSDWDEIVFQIPALCQAAALRRRLVHLAVGPRPSPGAASSPPPDLCGLDGLAHLHIFRPGCALEAAECLELALRRGDGPSMLLLSDTAIRSLRGQEAAENRCARGGYILIEADTVRRVTLIAEGSEVLVAAEAQVALAAEGIGAAVVSLPCVALLALQSLDYQRSVLGNGPLIAIRSVLNVGLDRLIGPDVRYVGAHGRDAAAIVREVRTML